MGHAVFYHTMMTLFLEVVVGVQVTGPMRHADGVASNGRGDAFGDVLAYHGPQEEQNRGSLHAHFSIWLVSHVYTDFLAKVERLSGEAGRLEALIAEWNQRTLEKVASIQFDSVCELPAVLRVGSAVRGEEDNSVPLTGGGGEVGGDPAEPAATAMQVEISLASVPNVVTPCVQICTHEGSLGAPARRGPMCANLYT